MKIYRIENSWGTGPYANCHLGWEDTDHYAKDHPSPEEDNILDYCCFHFGFISLNHLNDWFSKAEKIKLFKNGFGVKVYHSDEIKMGKRQIAFIK